MTLLHSHHPTHFLNVGNFRNSISPSDVFNNNNPYPHNFPSYIRSIYVQNNPKKVCSVLNIVKSVSQRENHK